MAENVVRVEKTLGQNRSKAISCVLGCHNSYQKSPPERHFYRFPSRPWEQEQRNKWLSAIKRTELSSTLCKITCDVGPIVRFLSHFPMCWTELPIRRCVKN